MCLKIIPAVSLQQRSPRRPIVDRTPWKAGRESAIGRVLLERAPIHILDAETDPEYRMIEMQSVGRYHSILGVPLMREGVLIGALLLSRRSVRPFTDRQIIAIENTRLLKELRESQILAPNLELRWRMLKRRGPFEPTPGVLCCWVQDSNTT